MVLKSSLRRADSYGELSGNDRDDQTRQDHAAMNRRAHRIGRGVTCLGLLSTTVYLGWRIATLPSRPPLWLVAVAIAVEVVGFVGSGLLAWALWHGPHVAAHTEDPTASIEPGEVDVMVRVDQQLVPDVRATLLALQTMTTGRVIVVDLGARREIAALAAEFETGYAATDLDDRNGLKTCAAAATGTIFLLLDGGDIPSPDAITRLLPQMNDDRVAVVIGPSLMADDDSAEHGPNGMHELTFERDTLNPALGARGSAILSESGALIRRVAVDRVEVGDEEPLEAQAYWSMALMTQGWRLVTAPGDPILVRQVVHSQDSVYERQVLHARAARTMVFGPEGIIGLNSLRLGQRMAIAAAAVRPLSGLRRGGFIAVVVGCLLTGSLPLRPDVRMLAGLWAPGWVLTSLGLGLMSGWTLRPGDRARCSLRNLGASWQGLRHPLAFDQRRAPIMTPHALQHGGALVASVVVLCSVMTIRGLSEQWTHALGAMPHLWLAGLVAVSLWSLAVALDVLRMFGKRNQLRRAARLVASIPAEVKDNPVAVFDVTALGAGFETNQQLEPRQELVLHATIATARGCTDVALPIVVRNVRNVTAATSDTERWRVGVEFVDPPADAINPLVEYCMVEPARRRLGAHSDTPIDASALVEAVAQPVIDGRRMSLRLISLAAVGGAIASAQPGHTTLVTSLVSAASILIAAGVLAGSARPRRAALTADQSTSSPSPDLAIR